MKLHFSDEERAFFKQMDAALNAEAERAVAEGRIENKYQFTKEISDDPAEVAAASRREFAEVASRLAARARDHFDSLIYEVIKNGPQSS